MTEVSEGHEIIIASLLATVVTDFWVVIFFGEIHWQKSVKSFNFKIVHDIRAKA